MSMFLSDAGSCIGMIVSNCNPTLCRVAGHSELKPLSLLQLATTDIPIMPSFDYVDSSLVVT